MNDDTDPFDIPYPTNSNTQKKEKEYSLKDHRKIKNKEYELKKKLRRIRYDKKNIENQLYNKLKDYFDYSADVEYDDGWKIITQKFKLSQLEKLKDDFDLEDVKVEFKDYDIIIKLELGDD